MWHYLYDSASGVLACETSNDWEVTSTGRAEKGLPEIPVGVSVLSLADRADQDLQVWSSTSAAWVARPQSRFDRLDDIRDNPPELLVSIYMAIPAAQRPAARQAMRLFLRRLLGPERWRGSTEQTNIGQESTED